MQQLLQAYPEAINIKGAHGETPLDSALKRVKRKIEHSTRLSASDPLIKLLKSGG